MANQPYCPSLLDGCSYLPPCRRPVLYAYRRPTYDPHCSLIMPAGTIPSEPGAGTPSFATRTYAASPSTASV